MSVVGKSIRLGRAARSTYHGLQATIADRALQAYARGATSRPEAHRLEHAVFWHMLDPTRLSAAFRFEHAGDVVLAGRPGYVAADAGFARVGSLRASGERTAKKRSF